MLRIAVDTRYDDSYIVVTDSRRTFDIHRLYHVDGSNRSVDIVTAPPAQYVVDICHIVDTHSDESYIDVSDSRTAAV